MGSPRAIDDTSRDPGGAVFPALGVVTSDLDFGPNVVDPSGSIEVKLRRISGTSVSQNCTLGP
jgi:hypothetical protein